MRAPLFLLSGFTASLFLTTASAKLLPYDFEHGIYNNNHNEDQSPRNGECLRRRPTTTTASPVTPVSDPFVGVSFASGYIPVGDGSFATGEMFYWYFPLSDGHPRGTTPLIVWLTGGPGCSSAMAALTENGPFNLDEDGHMSPNPYGWTTIGEMVYIDQPLGTGFSTIGDPRNAVYNEDQVAKDLREFLLKFLARYPQIEGRPLYITGESYAGHYVPAISHLLVKQPIDGLNFVGMAIGNGWVDPAVQYPLYATYAFEHNLVGEVGYQLAKKALQACVTLIDKKMYALAIVQCNAVVNGLLGKKNPYDVRLDCDIPPLCYNQTAIDTFLNNPYTQTRLNVKKHWVECSPTVYTLMLGDWCSDLSGKVADILEAGKSVLVYSGDQDFICNWAGGLAWVSNLNWTNSKKFEDAKFDQWSSSDGKRMGAVKKAENLVFLRVYGAGHMVPMDQPVAAHDMLEQWIGTGTLKTEREVADFAVVKEKRSTKAVVIVK